MKLLLFAAVTAILIAMSQEMSHALSRSSNNGHNSNFLQNWSSIPIAQKNTSISINSRIERIKEIDKKLRTESEYSRELHQELHEHIRVLYENQSEKARMALVRFLLEPYMWPFAYDSIIVNGTPISYDDGTHAPGVRIQRFLRVAAIASKLSGKSLPEILKPSMIRSALPNFFIHMFDKGEGEGGRLREIDILSAANPDQAQILLATLTTHEAAAVVMSVLDSQVILYPTCDRKKKYTNSNRIIKFSNKILLALEPELQPELRNRALAFPEKSDERREIERLISFFDKARKGSQLDGNLKGEGYCGAGGGIGSAFRGILNILLGNK
jgi:hypothetical protein